MPRLRPAPFSAAGWILALAAWMPPPAAADRVVLANGRVFEDVRAEVRAATVSIELGGGALVLPRDQVARIEPGPSTLDEYGRRAGALRAGRANAGEWLELARWASARAFDFGAREAALAAAALDPGLEGLGGQLRPLGYERDPATGGWYPFAEAMRRRGWVEDRGEWVPAAVAEARERARLEERVERRRAAEAARLEQLTELAELRLGAELARPAPATPIPVPYWAGWGVPVVVPVPVPSGPTPGPEPPAPPVGRAPARPTHQGILDRQPGSLIPIAPPS